MGHHYIGTEHLLLGLTRQSDTTAVDVFRELGHEPTSIQEMVLRTIEESSKEVLSKSTETSGQQVKSLDSVQDKTEVDEAQSTNVQVSSDSTTSTEKEVSDQKPTFVLGPPPDYVESLDQLKGARNKIEPSQAAAEEDEERDYEKYNHALAANAEKRDHLLQHFIRHYLLEANEKERAVRLLIGNTARQRVILEQFRSYDQYSQDLDATIDAFEDPLTPDDMVVVVGLHSARLALSERAAIFKDTDLEYMIDFGEINQAISLAILRPKVENQLNGLLQIEERIAQQTEANTQLRLRVLNLAIDAAERLSEPAPQLMNISLRLRDIDSQLARQTAHDAFRSARQQKNFVKSVAQTLRLAAQTHLETDQIQLLLRQHFDSGINMPDAEKNIPMLIQLQSQMGFSNAEREVVHQELWSLASSPVIRYTPIGTSQNAGERACRMPQTVSCGTMPARFDVSWKGALYAYRFCAAHPDPPPAAACVAGRHGRDPEPGPVRAGPGLQSDLPSERPGAVDARPRAARESDPATAALVGLAARGLGTLLPSAGPAGVGHLDRGRNRAGDGSHRPQ
jgi:hypothetical protein